MSNSNDSARYWAGVKGKRSEWARQRDAVLALRRECGEGLSLLGEALFCIGKGSFIGARSALARGGWLR